MATLLHIDASARRTRSLSRQLSRHFIDEWLKRRPADTVIRRDLGADPPPAVSEEWIDAVFTAPERRTKEQQAAVRLSDTLIDELEPADLIVMGTPMYNYGMPAALKAWFDLVIRVDRTFSFDLARGDWPLEPMLGGKRLVILSSRGEFGFAPGGVRQDMNHLDAHIRTCAKYLGVNEDAIITVEYQEFGGERHARSVDAGHAAVAPLVERLAEAIGGPPLRSRAVPGDGIDARE